MRVGEQKPGGLCVDVVLLGVLGEQKPGGLCVDVVILGVLGAGLMSDLLPMFKAPSPNEQLITNQVNSRLIVVYELFTLYL